MIWNLILVLKSQRVEPYTKVYSLQVPLRAIYRAITKSNRAIYRAIYRTITGIIFTKSDHRKWTNGQNLGRYITKITKIGNIEDLRGSQWVNIGHNNDITI